MSAEQREGDGEPETEHIEVEIAFGTVFSVRDRESGTIIDEMCVIIDVGENTIDVGSDDWFTVSHITKDELGYKLVGIVGTSGPKNLGEIVDQLTPDQVIEAAQKGSIHDCKSELNEKQLRYFQTSAQKPPRKIRIN